MKDVLQDIVKNKLIEVAQLKQAVSLSTLVRMGGERMEEEVHSMSQALSSSPSGIISEFKRKSPSKGWLHPNADVKEVVPAYEKAGASACSILTDGNFFGGSVSDLQQARHLVDLPLLRKDFIIDEYQLYQSRVLGADAILLIAACLTRGECQRLAECAHRLQLEVLLEIHSEEELDYLSCQPDMLGVNNRNLGTFDTNVDNSFKLVEKMKEAVKDSSTVLVAESGIRDTATVKKLRAAGFKGFLIGETFMKSEHPGATLQQFIQDLSC